MTLGVPVLLAWLAAGGLRVETGSPEALCPDLGQVRAAARARLGDIEAKGEWLASYTLVHRPDAPDGGDVVRLELTDPAGRLRLRRDLVRAGESCAALARALVVVLDAYFRHPAQADEGASGQKAAEAAVMTTAQTAAPAPARTRMGLDIDLAAGWSGGWAGRGDERSSPVVALGLRLAVLPPAWWIGVGGAVALTTRAEPVGTGIGDGTDARSASLRRYGLRAFVARDLVHTERVALLAGPEMMLDLDQADAAMLLDGARKVRASWGAGVRGQLEVRLTRRAFVTVLTALDYAPTSWGGTFLIGTPTGPREIFPASRWRLLLGAGVGLAVF